MRHAPFSFRADDGEKLHVHRWSPGAAGGGGDGDGADRPLRAVVHLAHGMAEHAARYARLAEALTAAGCVVYANDHRGHGLTARSREDLGFFAAKAGFRRVVRDLEQLLDHEREKHPGVPLVLFGHSMGSFMVQDLIIERSAAIDAAVLSGSAGKPGALAQAGRVVARAERLRLGGRGKSRLLTELSFGAYNKKLAPARTPFDWLSRDPAEVDAYNEDPLCGFMCTTSLWVELLDALAEIASPERQARIRKDLPIYVFAGSEDPVSEGTRSLRQLLGAYERAGLRNVTSRFYEGGRHEMLNETNRDEVTRELVAWLDRVLSAAK